MKRTAFSIRTGLFLCLGTLLIATACNNNSSQKNTKPLLSDSARAANKRIDSLRRASYRNNDLSIIFLDATSQIMQAQMVLEKADYAGNKPQMVDSLIINSDSGDSLYYALRRMYMAATAFAETEEQRARFNAMTMPDSTKLWLQKHFKGSTPSGALSALTKFQNDCTVINKIIRK
ncbi:hypothetical protein FAM09_17910 [Niastella caeni]|uniref:DUF4142 domain-containing protein n=1 Tax=Niastella caeni TaxID=2569763 RepID=A0A4S8HUP7_9BACT|nr:hypothetical protein [Niastella caeni]THU36842.1 hypothetical protein FAM09_17910 [Niastella caeni]